MFYYLGCRECQAEVYCRRNHQRLCNTVGRALYRCNGVHDLAKAYRVADRGFLNYRNKLVCDSRQNVLYSLRQDDKAHVLRLRKAERTGSLGLSAVNALDAGAEDFSEEDDSFEILTDPDNFEEVRKALEDAGIPMVSAEVTMIPQNYVTLTDETAVKNLQRTLDLLEDDDDVQAVYHNWDE